MEDESFFRLNFNIYSYVDNRQRARPRKIMNFSLRECEHIIAAVGKCEMLGASKVKMRGSERMLTE